MKSYKQFISESKEFKSIKSICDKYGIFNYTINSDGSIDVVGDVDLSNENLDKLPLKFRNVSGGFYCNSNKLTTLEGCPQTVDGDFYCSYPASEADFTSAFTNQLTTLKGCPQTVDGDFYCHENQLTTLEGGPENVSGNFSCSNNQLTTLEGGPENVGGNFYCDYNQLLNFNGFPEDFEGDVYLNDNPVKEIYDLFKSVKCIRWINEFDVIQGNKVIMDRLEEVYHELGMDIPDNIKLKNYEII